MNKWALKDHKRRINVNDVFQEVVPTVKTNSKAEAKGLFKKEFGLKKLSHRKIKLVPE